MEINPTTRQTDRDSHALTGEIQEDSPEARFVAAINSPDLNFAPNCLPRFFDQRYHDEMKAAYHAYEALRQSVRAGAKIDYRLIEPLLEVAIGGFFDAAGIGVDDTKRENRFIPPLHPSQILVLSQLLVAARHLAVEHGREEFLELTAEYCRLLLKEAEKHVTAPWGDIDSKDMRGFDQPGVSGYEKLLGAKRALAKELGMEEEVEGILDCEVRARVSAIIADIWERIVALDVPVVSLLAVDPSVQIVSVADGLKKEVSSLVPSVRGAVGALLETAQRYEVPLQSKELIRVGVRNRINWYVKKLKAMGKFLKARQLLEVERIEAELGCVPDLYAIANLLEVFEVLFPGATFRIDGKIYTTETILPYIESRLAELKKIIDRLELKRRGLWIACVARCCSGLSDGAFGRLGVVIDGFRRFVNGLKAQHGDELMFRDVDGGHARSTCRIFFPSHSGGEEMVKYLEDGLKARSLEESDVMVRQPLYDRDQPEIKAEDFFARLDGCLAEDAAKRRFRRLGELWKDFVGKVQVCTQLSEVEAARDAFVGCFRKCMESSRLHKKTAKSDISMNDVNFFRDGSSNFSELLGGLLAGIRSSIVNVGMQPIGMWGVVDREAKAKCKRDQIDFLVRLEGLVMSVTQEFPEFLPAVATVESTAEEVTEAESATVKKPFSPPW